MTKQMGEFRAHPSSPSSGTDRSVSKSLTQSWRKKPIVVDAVQVTKDNWSEVKNWCAGKDWRNNRRTLEIDYIVFTIQTLEGNMAVQWGDYIIQGVKGEFYPCKPDIFKKTYEKVTTAASPDSEPSKTRQNTLEPPTKENTA